MTLNSSHNYVTAIYIVQRYRAGVIAISEACSVLLLCAYTLLNLVSGLLLPYVYFHFLIQLVYWYTNWCWRVGHHDFYNFCMLYLISSIQMPMYLVDYCTSNNDYTVRSNSIFNDKHSSLYIFYGTPLTAKNSTVA